MDYRSSEMAVFSAVAEAGGFSAAGRRLHLTPSAVSKLIARLEDRLGTPLFTRSTRRLQLTAEGVLYLERVRRILAEMDEADRLVGSGAGAVPRGRLRVSASVAFGECCILPLAPDEAYYWVWSRDLQGGYLDHPPMVALFHETISESPCSPST